MPTDEIVNVRYMVDDVDESIAFYTKLLDFELLTSAAPAFADVKRGALRLLLAGPTSSAGRPMPDGTKPGPGGWNRIHFVVDDIDAEVAQLRAAGARFRNDIVDVQQSRDPSIDIGNLGMRFEPLPQICRSSFRISNMNEMTYHGFWGSERAKASTQKPVVNSSDPQKGGIRGPNE